jgi:iron complex transport system substrate-binding protein
MERIVSLCPSNTEILALLGLKERIVGVDNFSDWPEEVKQLPQCGPDLDIDLDKVKSLRPDLVVASLSVPGMEKNIEGLKREGIPHLVLAPKRIEDIPEDIRRTGKAVGVGDQAERVAARFEQRLEEIRKRVPKGRPSPRLYWEWWPKPVFTPGKRNWLNDVSEIVGGVNIFGDMDQENVQTDWEEVARREPDVALIVWTGIPINRVRKERILNRPPWQGKPFAQESRVHILEEGWYCRPSPRLLTGIEYLAHLLYPEAFSPPDPDAPLGRDWAEEPRGW